MKTFFDVYKAFYRVITPRQCDPKEIIQLDEVCALCSWEDDQVSIWDLFSGRMKVGQCALFRQETELNLQVWVVGNIWLIQPVRHRGLMRRLLTLLRPRYPNLVSDFGGDTSKEAIRMWKALGAEELTTERCPKGFVYLLR